MNEKKLSKRDKVLILMDFIILVLLVVCIFFQEPLEISKKVVNVIKIFSVIIIFAVVTYGCISLIILILFRNKNGKTEEKTSEKNKI